jgi:hypothetical protein
MLCELGGRCLEHEHEAQVSGTIMLDAGDNMAYGVVLIELSEMIWRGFSIEGTVSSAMVARSQKCFTARQGRQHASKNSWNRAHHSRRGPIVHLLRLGQPDPILLYI